MEGRNGEKKGGLTNLTVCEWHADRADNAKNWPSSRAGKRSLSATLGLVGTVLLHALVIQSLILGNPPLAGDERLHSWSNRLPAHSDTLPGLSLLDPSFTANVATSPPAIASETRATVFLPDLPTVAMPRLVMNTEQDMDKLSFNRPLNASNAASREEQLGLYRRQVDARIQRAWQRPRSPIFPALVKKTDADRSFNCQVQIMQDRRGNVQEILLRECEGTTEWRHSLIVAIRDSSPLPSPSDSSAFSDALVMTFTSDAYRSGQSPDGFEPE